MGALLCGLILVTAEGRSIDEERYNDYILRNLPTLLEEIKQLEWERSNFMDTSVPYEDEGRWESYEEDDDPLPLRDVPGWPSTSAVIGQVGGVAVDTDDNLVVFHRAGRRWDASSFGPGNKLNPALGPIASDVIMTIKRDTGEVLNQWGAGMFYMPHGLSIDDEGNVWVTDVGLHQVMKFPKGSTNASLVLGTAMEPNNDDKHFCKPTDVVVAPNGEFFVSDGYCNGRIIKYSADGTILTQWGTQSNGSYPLTDYEFLIPHSLTLDPSRDTVCVADRENERIQCFSAGLYGKEAGIFVKSFTPGRGPVFAIEYVPGADVIYAVNGPGIGIIEGFTIDMVNGNILETWAPERQKFGQPHDVTVSNDGADVYVGDIGMGKKVWKFDRPNIKSPPAFGMM